MQLITECLHAELLKTIQLLLAWKMTTKNIILTISERMHEDMNTGTAEQVRQIRQVPVSQDIRSPHLAVPLDRLS